MFWRGNSCHLTSASRASCPLDPGHTSSGSGTLESLPPPQPPVSPSLSLSLSFIKQRARASGTHGRKCGRFWAFSGLENFKSSLLGLIYTFVRVFVFVLRSIDAVPQVSTGRKKNKQTNNKIQWTVKLDVQHPVLISMLPFFQMHLQTPGHGINSQVTVKLPLGRTEPRTCWSRTCCQDLFPKRFSSAWLSD